MIKLLFLKDHHYILKGDVIYFKNLTSERNGGLIKCGIAEETDLKQTITIQEAKDGFISEGKRK